MPSAACSTRCMAPIGVVGVALRRPCRGGRALAGRPAHPAGRRRPDGVHRHARAAGWPCCGVRAMRLPVARRHGRHRAAGAPGRREDPMTILIVDDQPLTCQGLATLLSATRPGTRVERAYPPPSRSATSSARRWLPVPAASFPVPPTRNWYCAWARSGRALDPGQRSRTCRWARPGRLATLDPAPHLPRPRDGWRDRKFHEFQPHRHPP